MGVGWLRARRLATAPAACVGERCVLRNEFPNALGDQFWGSAIPQFVASAGEKTAAGTDVQMKERLYGWIVLAFTELDLMKIITASRVET